MVRIIKAGPRPFIMLGLVFAFPLGMLFMLGPKDPSYLLELLKGTVLMVLLYGTIVWSVWRTQLVVTEDAISLRRSLGRPKTVQFQDISRSVALVLAEPEHPIALSIYCADPELPELSLRLKPYRQEDVAWLLSLPGLKVVQ